MSVQPPAGPDASLTPAQVRERVLSDHARLRGILDRVELQAGGGEASNPSELREAGEELHRVLARHMLWEDHYLAPALRNADAWGEERVARLRKDHLEQRAILADNLDRLRDEARPDELLMRDLRDLVLLLRDDMEQEERDLLDPSVLRDDVVAIDLEAG